MRRGSGSFSVRLDTRYHLAQHTDCTLKGSDVGTYFEWQHAARSIMQECRSQCIASSIHAHGLNAVASGQEMPQNILHRTSCISDGSSRVTTHARRSLPALGGTRWQPADPCIAGVGLARSRP